MCRYNILATHTGKAVGVDNVGWLVNTFFCTDIHSPQRMNLNDISFSDTSKSKFSVIRFVMTESDSIQSIWGLLFTYLVLQLMTEK